MYVFRQPASVITLFVALVRSILEYCSVVWSPIYNIHIDRIEAIQRRFFRHLSSKFGLRRTLSTYDARLEYFGLPTLQSRRKVYEYSTLYKIINAKWDASELLSHFSIKIGSNRKQTLFSLPSCNNNVTYNDPVFRMCRAHNDHCKDLDVFFQSHSAYLNKCSVCIINIMLKIV